MIAVSNKNGFISHPLIKENSIKRREYQETIFINCLNTNCMVIIPTGLGKTIVALMLAVQRLTEFPDSKVILLAPTKPLVNQHYASFLELTIIPPENLKAITGTIPPEKRKELWDELRVGFMTPQVLQNDIISNTSSLKEVCLVIFDECHRAVGDYAYCFIAKKYMESAKNPQILGLTASPGSTEGKINEIKSNLFIDHIEIRTEKDSDVKSYIQKVDNEWIKVKLPPEFLDIKNIITEKLRTSYKHLKDLNLLNSSDITKVVRKDLLKVDSIINNRLKSIRDDNEKYLLFAAKKTTANAIRLSYMDELIETQGISAFSDYIAKNIEKVKKSEANKSLLELLNDPDFRRIIKLKDAIIARNIVHPKLEKLQELLNAQLQENPESRILVFCHFRDSVNNIVKYLEDYPTIKAHKFVGQQSKSLDKGLSQKQQISLISEFREGVYNTLIGTSVAEEGLDIAECDLVVFYDVVPSAIRSIQRRGRTGRKKEGKVLVLMAENTRDEGYYWAEKANERKMKESLKKIKEEELFPKKSQSNILNFIESSNDKGKVEPNNKNKSLSIINKIEGADKFTIICDNRETASPVVRNLSLMGIDLKLEQLNVGDYVISDRVGIERKSADDFNDSLKDGRLFNELFDLKNNFERSILILEGNPIINTALSSNAVYGAIASIILNLGILVYKTADSNETAEFLYQLAKKEQSENKNEPKLRFDKKPIETSRLLEYIIAGLPGVNTLRAKNLLKELSSLQSIFNADIGDLLKIENIGKKIAQEIYRISRYKYKNDN